MIARARCERCGEIGKFDVGEVSTVADAQAKLDSAHIESCPFGNHIELSPIRYEVVDLLEGAAPTMEEWRARMIEGGHDLWTTDELRATEIEITGFAMGFPMATVRGKDFWLDFCTAPDGERYYHAPRGAYTEAVGGD